MYRVFITGNGNFRAVAGGSQPDSIDISNSFEVSDWQVFEQELRHRLLNETTQTLRETAPGKERRKGATSVPFTYR